MSVRHVLAASAAAHPSVQLLAADTHDLTTERLVASAAVLVALAGAVIGGLALARAGRIGQDNGRGKRGPLAALVAGPIGMAVGAVDLAVADGGPGTGNGVVGAALALVLGLIATVLGRLALVRTARLPRPPASVRVGEAEGRNSSRR